MDTKVERRRYAVATAKGAWTSEEDSVLCLLVAIHGEGAHNVLGG